MMVSYTFFCNVTNVTYLNVYPSDYIIIMKRFIVAYSLETFVIIPLTVAFYFIDRRNRMLSEISHIISLLLDMKNYTIPIFYMMYIVYHNMVMMIS